MRRASFIASFVALGVLLVLLWTYRFERAPGLPVWTMPDLRAGLPEIPGVEWAGTADDPILRLKVDAQTPRVALRLAIPGVPTIGMLQLRYRMVASGLTQGPQNWDSGRMMVEWYSPVGEGDAERDPVGGVKHNEDTGNITLIAVPEDGPARPALRIEHLGHAGKMEIMDLEITAVRERDLWKTGRWFLICGWLVWVAAFIGSCSAFARWRVMVAAGIWLLMGVHFVVPGPWKIQRPLITPFRVYENVKGPSSGQAPPAVASVINSGAVTASGKIPVRGGLALRIKMIAAQARPLLHILLLLGPVFASAMLVGRKPTLFLAILLSLAIEGAQLAFGYGFDWIDVFDLLTDAAGIALGLWLAARLRHGLTGRDPSIPSQNPAGHRS